MTGIDGIIIFLCEFKNLTRHLRIRLRHTPFSKLFRRDKKLIQIFNNAILKLRLTYNKLLPFLAFKKEF